MSCFFQLVSGLEMVSEAGPLGGQGDAGEAKGPADGGRTKANWGRLQPRCQERQPIRKLDAKGRQPIHSQA